MSEDRHLISIPHVFHQVLCLMIPYAFPRSCFDRLKIVYTKLDRWILNFDIRALEMEAAN